MFNLNSPRVVYPSRLLFFRQHRKKINTIQANPHLIAHDFPAKPPKQQKTVSDPRNFKDVTLNEIDTQIDQVLIGCVIIVSLIDIPCIFSASEMNLLIEDKNQFVEYLSVFNLGSDAPLEDSESLQSGGQI